MSDQDLFDEVYDGNNYAMLVLELDGESMKLKLKAKKIPGIGESGTIWAKRKGRKWILNIGLGDEEYDDDQMPNAIKKLISSAGGGPNGNAVVMPPLRMVIHNGYSVRPYAEYRRLFTSRKYFDVRPNDKPLPESLYYIVAKLYLEQMGVPLFI